MNTSLPNPAPARRQFLKVFPSIALPMFLALVDQTIVATALPAISADFNELDRVAWIVVAYLTAAAISAPVYGRLGDAFGRRRLLIAALLISSAGSLMCAVSGSLEMLVCARILQGLGGGGLMSLSQALIGQTVAPSVRARYQGYLSSTGVSASAFGPVMGAFLTAEFGWRAVFVVSLPFTAMAILLTLRLPGKIGLRDPFRFDWPGLALFAIAITALLLTTELVRAEAATPAQLALMGSCLGLALLMLVTWEKRAPDPLLPLPLLSRPTIWRCNLLAAIQGGILISTVTFIPLYLRGIQGLHLQEIGIVMVPVMIGVSIGSIITGQLVSMSGRTAIFPSWGLVFVAGLFATLGLASGTLSVWGLAALLAATTFFLGTVMTVVQVLVQVSAGPRLLGTAAASVQLSRAVGSAIGAAVAGTVLLASAGMADRESAEALRLIIGGNGEALNALSSIAEQQVRDRLAGAFAAMFFALSAVSVVAAGLAWSLPERRI